MTAEQRVWVFFYGSYMNRAVLAEVQLVPGDWEAARLCGFDIDIAPRANLVQSDRACVYGVLATATHRELQRLYTEHSQQVLGETYLPQAVLAESLSGKFRPALCYIASEMNARAPEREYVDRILGPARELGFPTWYVARLASFRQ